MQSVLKVNNNQSTVASQETQNLARLMHFRFHSSADTRKENDHDVQAVSLSSHFPLLLLSNSDMLVLSLLNVACLFGNRQQHFCCLSQIY